jgi:YD repeat-containing protein
MHPRLASRRPPTSRPAVEALEARCLLASGPALVAAPAPAAIVSELTEPLHIDFDWRVPDRFGVDNGFVAANGVFEPKNGLVDLPNTWAYANPSAFSVTLTGTASAPIASATWQLGGTDLPTWAPRSLSAAVSGSTFAASVYLPEGSYPMTLTVRTIDGRTAAVQRTVVVKDYLIVSIGDSYASGEGNPEVNRATHGGVAQWADDGLGSAPGSSFLADRSTKAATAQAALALEQADPHTSVTFIFLATSGATIRDGLLGPGQQLDRLASIVGTRRIDALFVSGGGNDLGFSHVIHDLISPLGESIPQLQSELMTNLAALPGLYARLDSAIRSRFQVSNVYLTEYPDGTYDGNGATPGAILGDVVPLLSVDRGEILWARQNLIQPLQAAERAAASALGWTYVGDISSAFRTHGYAADDPYAPTVDPNRARWIRTATESVNMQGPDSTQDTQGTMHPNELGQAAIRRILLGDLAVLNSPFGFASAADGREHVVTQDPDGHLCDRSYDGAWHKVDLTLMTASSRPAGRPAGYTTADGVAHVVYRDIYGQIIELTFNGSWSRSNLTTLTGAPAAASDPTAFLWTADGSSHVDYRDVHGNVVQLFRYGNSWYVASLMAAAAPAVSTATASPTAAPAIGQPTGFGNAWDGSQHVDYRAADGRLIDLRYQGGWVWRDLNQLTGAPRAASDPTAYVWDADGTQHLVYRDESGNIQELYFAGGRWNWNNLTVAAGAAKAVGDPAGYVWGGTQHVVYRDVNGNIQELYLTGGGWRSNNLTSATGPRMPPATRRATAGAAPNTLSTATSTATSRSCTTRGPAGAATTSPPRPMRPSSRSSASWAARRYRSRRRR